MNLESLKLKAAQGDKDAIFEVAKYYHTNGSSFENLQNAITWYENGIALGDIRCYYPCSLALRVRLQVELPTAMLLQNENLMNIYKEAQSRGLSDVGENVFLESANEWKKLKEYTDISLRQFQSGFLSLEGEKLDYLKQMNNESVEYITLFLFLAEDYNGVLNNTNRSTAITLREDIARLYAYFDLNVDNMTDNQVIQLATDLENNLQELLKGDIDGYFEQIFIAQICFLLCFVYRDNLEKANQYYSLACDKVNQEGNAEVTVKVISENLKEISKIENTGGGDPGPDNIQDTMSENIKNIVIGIIIFIICAMCINS